MKNKTDEGVRIVLFSVVLNALLFLLKGTVGILAYSTALQADAVNSAGDTMSSLASLFGIKYSIKPHDNDHHYGHGKMEAFVSLFVGLVILVSAGFLWRSIITIVISGEFLQSNIWALIVALIAIIIKLFMYIKTMRVGKKINSIAVKANALDHMNDIYATSATAVAIFLSLLARITGIHILRYSEPIASAIMSIFIIKTGIEIITSSTKMLMDAAPNEYIVDSLKVKVNECDGVRYLNWLKCRTIGRGILVDLAVEVDENITVKQGHDLADDIKHAIQVDYQEVLDVLVHINPHKMD
jgi:cation diffusion facilitator family transporter